ncbi:MAG: DUF1992 domain-containing protein [Ilumatobacter sp.]|uniref:DnaJ family domain-containing protein n=1 Tax=Ilumatobacter sp. TaxID=1967498 RepID=UPI00391CE300
MTERKPDNVSWESWVERQIQDGQRAGAFDALPGHGRPLDGLDSARDELWWVKAKLRDEQISALPPTIAIRAERADAIDAALRAGTDAEARQLLDAVNERIRYLNSHATAGPPSTVVTVDVDVIIERRHAERRAKISDTDPTARSDADSAGNPATDCDTDSGSGAPARPDAPGRPPRRWQGWWFRRRRA